MIPPWLLKVLRIEIVGAQKCKAYLEIRIVESDFLGPMQLIC